MRGLLTSLLLLVLVPPALAQISYEEGDTLRFTAAFVDSSAAAALPDSARLYVLLRGAILDSTVTYPSGGISQVGGTNQMAGSYIIPDVGDLPVQLNLLLRCDGDGFSNDVGMVYPRDINVNAEIGSVKNLYAQAADSSVAVVDTSSCTPCGVYSSGSPADGEVVITSAQTLASISTFESQVAATNGYWRTLVRTTPGAADTFYVWRRAAGSRWELASVQMVVP